MVYSSVPDKNIIKINFKDEEKSGEYKWEDLLLDIYAAGATNKLTNAELGDKFSLTPSSALFKKTLEDDLFIIAAPDETSEKDVEKELERMVALRKAMKSRFLGMMFSDWNDESGPVPAYNDSPLDETQTIMLAAQGASMSAMGQKKLPDRSGPVFHCIKKASTNSKTSLSSFSPALKTINSAPGLPPNCILGSVLSGALRRKLKTSV